MSGRMFYAFVPDRFGTEPVGGDKKLIRKDLTSPSAFVRLARKALGGEAKCFEVVGGDFYRRDCFVALRGQRGKR